MNANLLIIVIQALDIVPMGLVTEIMSVSGPILLACLQEKKTLYIVHICLLAACTYYAYLPYLKRCWSRPDGLGDSSDGSVGWTSSFSH